MRRDLVLLLIIVVSAVAIRSCPAWNSVFTPEGVSYLDTDAWYHVRLIEHQVRNYPWRVTLDPYAAPGGQFVPIAPLLNTVTSTVVVLRFGRDAPTAAIERIAVWVPPVLGALTVIAVWALARRLFDRRAALIAAALLAVLPGHFLVRTTLGFVDHHALEALLAVTMLLALVDGITTRRRWSPLAAGLVLGLYLLSWSSGAFLVAILAVWLVGVVACARSGDELASAASLTGGAAMVALVLVLAFQDPLMHRYASQIVALIGLAGVAGLVWIVTARGWSPARRRVLLGTIAGVPLATVAMLALVAPTLLGQMAIDIARLSPTPDPRGMAVLEARPLFLYSGEWRWNQPWAFFRTGVVILGVALVPFALRVRRERRAGELLLLVFTVATLVATVGQNRFGYYLVPAVALLGGWLGIVLLDWGRVPQAESSTSTPRRRPVFARAMGVIAVAGLFAPNFTPETLLAERRSSFDDAWRDAMTWLAFQTPPPFPDEAGGPDAFYLGRYPRDEAPLPAYTVMNWWDHGYWIVQRARRVPVANPTQTRAPVSARFYAETDPTRAVERLRAERSRYVLADSDLPFRLLADGTLMGGFQNVVDWAGAAHDRYYEIAYRRTDTGWIPAWIFHEAYYQSMAFRLSVLGGQDATPIHATTVVTLASRVDDTGAPFRELLHERTFTSYDDARAALVSAPPDSFIVGLDPWRTAFPVERLASIVEVRAWQTWSETGPRGPFVRVFELR